MGYRVMPGRALETVGEEALHAVQSAVRRRDGALVLAMLFDPGTATDTALGTHAVDDERGANVGWASEPFERGAEEHRQW